MARVWVLASISRVRSGSIVKENECEAPEWWCEWPATCNVPSHSGLQPPLDLPLAGYTKVRQASHDQQPWGAATKASLRTSQSGPKAPWHHLQCYVHCSQPVEWVAVVDAQTWGPLVWPARITQYTRLSWDATSSGLCCVGLDKLLLLWSPICVGVCHNEGFWPVYGDNVLLPLLYWAPMLLHTVFPQTLHHRMHITETKPELTRREGELAGVLGSGIC